MTWIAVIWSIVLLIPLAFIYCLSVFAGRNTVGKSWKANGYRVDHFVSQGFSGSPLCTFELRKYTVIPLLIRNAKVQVEDSTTAGCKVHFAESGVELGKCSRTIIKKQLPQSTNWHKIQL